MLYRPFVPDYVVRLIGVQAGGLPFVRKTEGAVLFADIVGYTTLSAALADGGPDGAEELSTLLNRFFARMVDLVADHGGIVSGFAGDAITAVFLRSRSTRAAAIRRATRCALDMQAASLDFRAVPTAAGTFTLGMRVGVGTGEVVMAVVGDEETRLEHVLTGEAVSRAIAAEQRAEPGQVLVDPVILAGGHGIGSRPAPAGCGLVVGVAGPRGRARPVPDPVDERAELIRRRLPAFLHPAIAERVRQGKTEFVAERRTVTVAFVDCSGLTDNPTDAIDQLQRFVAQAVRVIDRWGGHLRQVDLGDKGSMLVIAFGAPVRPEHQEERALRCCIELLGLPGGPSRAGITTGRTWCGEVGSTPRREYAIVGDTVNLAARLMEAARPGQALVDHATWAPVERTAVARHLPGLAIRGRNNPVEAWSVRRMRERTDLRDGARGIGSIVGRRTELATVRSAVDRVATGLGTVLGITGEPGIGKSRLADEALGHARRLGFTTAAGGSRSLGPDISYLPWRSVWRELLGLDAWSGPHEQQDALARFGPHAPLLGPMLNIGMPDNELTAPLDPAARADLLRSLLADELRERARSAPLAILIEDCHWIDPPSSALLEFLARNLADQRVLLVVTARPTPAGRRALDGLASLPRYHRIRLGELPPDDAAALATERAHQLDGHHRAPAPETVERIVERAGGNPFYLEELLRLVHTRDASGQDGDLDLPDSVERVVMARLDQLSEGEKAVLKVASVIGRLFRADWISGCYPAAGSSDEVARHLRRLDALGLTPAHAVAAEPEYSFRHTITQEVTYNSLTVQMRTLLHERAGDYIERTFPERLTQFVETLAFHYGRTARVDKQRIWFGAAADGARDVFANESAIAHYQRLLPLLEGPAAGYALIDLGTVWQLIGRWDDARQGYLQALAIARSDRDLALEAAVGRELGNLFIYTTSYAEAIEWLTLAEETFERLGDRSGLSRTLDRRAYALIQQGSYEQASAIAHRHLTLAEEAGDLAGMSVALDHLGIISGYTGDPTEALALLRRSLQVATEANDRRGVVHAANNLGGLHAARGEHPQALDCAVQALGVAREIGYRQMAGVIIGNIGELYRDQGDHERATGCFGEALRIAVELGDLTSVANRVASLAGSAADRGDLRRAEQLYVPAIQLARTLDAPHFLCEWLHSLAQLLTADGRPGEAGRHNEEALAIAARHAERHVELRALLLRLQLQVDLGRMSAGEAARAALALEGAWPEPSERAAVLDAAARFDPALTSARDGAAELYRELYARGSDIRYRQAHERLTGATLAAAAPLPPVPDVVTGGAVDVDELLRQVEPMEAKLSRARAGI